MSKRSTTKEDEIEYMLVLRDHPDASIADKYKISGILYALLGWKGIGRGDDVMSMDDALGDEPSEVPEYETNDSKEKRKTANATKSRHPRNAAPED